MILISSNVVNERQNKFYSGLYQHDIRYNRKRRSDEAVPPLAGPPISKFPNTLPPIRQVFQAGELVAYSYTELLFLKLRGHSLYQQKRQIFIPLITSRNHKEGINGTLPLSPYQKSLVKDKYFPNQ